jgi:hypothetical protein
MLTERGERYKLKRNKRTVSVGKNVSKTVSKSAVQPFICGSGGERFPIEVVMMLLTGRRDYKVSLVR